MKNGGQNLHGIVPVRVELSHLAKTAKKHLKRHNEIAVMKLYNIKVYSIQVRHLYIFNSIFNIFVLYRILLGNVFCNRITEADHQFMNNGFLD